MYRYIAQTLKTARLKKGMTQKQASKISGVPRERISKMETCRELNLRLGEVELLCQTYNTRLVVYIDPALPHPPPPSTTIRIADKIKTMDKNNKDWIYRAIELVSENSNPSE